MKRLERVELRVTRQELDDWDAKAADSGQSRSDLIRASMRRCRSRAADRANWEREKVRLLAWCGNNLNQIAQWAVLYKDAADSIQVLSAVIALGRAMQKTMQGAEAPGTENVNVD